MGNGLHQRLSESEEKLRRGGSRQVASEHVTFNLRWRGMVQPLKTPNPALAPLTRSLPLSRPHEFAHLCRGFPTHSICRNRERCEKIASAR